MINIKSNRGITVVSLVITIVVLLILSGTAIYNVKMSKDVGRYNKMVADIELLNDKILIYYNKYNDIPTTTREFNVDENEYHEIDLSKLEEITLNYGSEYGKDEELTSSSDVYLVNSNLNIYYLKGIEKSGQVFHER